MSSMLRSWRNRFVDGNSLAQDGAVVVEDLLGPELQDPVEFLADGNL